MNRTFTVVLIIMIFVMIAGLFIFDRYVITTFISEIYNSPTGSFEYSGKTYIRQYGYVSGLFLSESKPGLWLKLGKTDNWENIYYISGGHDQPPKLIYIDGEEPALYAISSFEIPVSGEKTALFVYSDPDTYTNYRTGNYRNTVQLISQITQIKGDMYEYETDDIKSIAEYFSFAYDNCAAGSAQAEKYLICRLNNGKYVYVPDYKNNLTVNDDDSARFYGIMINDKNIMQYLDESRLFFPESICLPEIDQPKTDAA